MFLQCFLLSLSPSLCLSLSNARTFSHARKEVRKWLVGEMRGGERGREGEGERGREGEIGRDRERGRERKREGEREREREG